jgi:YVTN family beta-propeller protein
VSISDQAVTPVDVQTGIAGTPIAVSLGPHDIAITPDGATAYVTNSSADSVTPIDTATNTVETPIAVAAPFGIAITPDGATAYVANFGTDSVTPIDTATNTAGTPIAVGANPAAIAITPDGATAYVTNANADSVTPIDTATNTAGTPIAVGVDPFGIAVAPNQRPSAAFGATPAPAGSSTSFDASASTDADGTVATYRWDFGDGQAATTSSPGAAHVYADPGTYTATLTVTDNEGCSTAFVFTGQTASCNGSAVARTQHQVTVPAAPAPPPPPGGEGPSAGPAIQRFTLATRCMRRSRTGRVRVRMNLRMQRPGRVRVQVERAIGSKGRRNCPRPGPGRRFNGRFRKVHTLNHVRTSPAAAAVTRRITLSLRLSPGLYRITVRAYKSGNKLSRPARRYLRVLR